MSDEDQSTGAEVFVERAISSALGVRDIFDCLDYASACLRVHRVELRQILTSADGQRKVYHFRAPDAEAVRMALRRAGIEYDLLRVERSASRSVQNPVRAASSQQTTV